MSNEVKSRTEEVILDEIKIVKDRIKPQFEEVEKFIYNVRPKLVKEKEEIQTRLENSNYELKDIDRLFVLDSLLYDYVKVLIIL